jgi:methionyl-tRNA formyltransferase
MRFIFMGTPSFGEASLRYLIKNHTCLAVVTQPDKKVGRKKVLTSSAIKKVALEEGLLCLQPVSVKTIINQVKEMAPDMIITAAFGQILPQKLLDIPPLGCLNLHASILPKYRGAAPIQHAIKNEEDETGVSLMQMTLKMDAGAVYGVKKTKVLNKTFGELFSELSEIAKDVLEEYLDPIIKRTIIPVPQDESKVTFAPKILREDEWLDLNQDAKKVLAQLRSLLPSPGGLISLDNEPLKILNARLGDQKGKSGDYKASKKSLEIICQEGSIILETVQPPSKKAMPVTAYLNGKSADFFKDVG